jgi:hypothetical protein
MQAHMDLDKIVHRSVNTPVPACIRFCSANVVLSFARVCNLAADQAYQCLPMLFPVHFHSFSLHCDLITSIDGACHCNVSM